MWGKYFDMEDVSRTIFQKVSGFLKNQNNSRTSKVYKRFANFPNRKLTFQRDIKETGYESYDNWLFGKTDLITM